VKGISDEDDSGARNSISFCIMLFLFFHFPGPGVRHQVKLQNDSADEGDVGQIEKESHPCGRRHSDNYAPG